MAIRVAVLHPLSSPVLDRENRIRRAGSPMGYKVQRPRVAGSPPSGEAIWRGQWDRLPTVSGPHPAALNRQSGSVNRRQSRGRTWTEAADVLAFTQIAARGCPPPSPKASDHPPALVLGQ